MSRSYSSVRTIVQSLAWLALVCVGMQGSTVRADVPAPSATVRGVAWNSDNSPLPNAKVRLRNTHSGKLEANSVTDPDGQFTFSPVQDGPYLVELLGENGKVVAVGPSFRVGVGETVSTSVKLSAQRPWAAVVFSSTAAAVIAAAAHAGLTALGPSGSGSRPISPQ